MRPNTPKRAALDRACAREREQYRRDVGRCHLCRGPAMLGVHEISSGTAGRPLSVSERASWLLLCNVWLPCHRIVDGWPKAKQLCLKLAVDPENYDLAKFNECYTLGRIHQNEVDDWAVDIQAVLEFVSTARTREDLLELMK